MTKFRVKMRFDLEILDDAAAEQLARQMLRDRPWDPTHEPVVTDDGASEEVKIHELAQEPRVQATMAASNLWLQGAKHGPVWVEVSQFQAKRERL